MRRNNLLIRYFTTAPLVFPLIGLFHLYLSIAEVLNYVGDSSVHSVYLFRPAFFILFTVFWIGCCFLKHWAALGYLALTMATISFNFFGPDGMFKHAVGDVLFAPVPVNLLCAFLVLFYYPRMQAGHKRIKSEGLQKQNNGD